MVAIVEGHGEATAVPELIARWFKYRRFENFQVTQPAVCTRGCGSLKASYDHNEGLGVEYFVKNALRMGPSAIVIVLDSDDECILRGRNGTEKLGPELLRRATAVSNGVPVAVAIANRSFESWFMASLQRIRNAGIFPSNARLPSRRAIDELPGHKGRIGRWLSETRGTSYEERIHMNLLAAQVGFSKAACRRSPSFGKLIRELERVTTLARGAIEINL